MNCPSKLLLVTVLLSACGGQDKIQPTDGYRRDQNVSDSLGIPADKKVFYFEPIDFRDTFPIPYMTPIPPYDTVKDQDKVPLEYMKKEYEVEIDSFALKWFSEIIYNNQEPVLSNFYTGNEIYRLIWLRTFHQGVIIKLMSEKGKYYIQTKWLASEIHPSKESTREIAADLFNDFKAKLEEHRFWNIKSYNWDLGNDGAQWILESSQKNRYHFISRWSPDLNQSDGLRELGEFLIINSDAKNEEVY